MTIRQGRQDGFTVIEVMLVIAVSGVIMLIVFAALPTLQRNSRNNQRKQDVAAVLQAVSRYELNNSGNYPDATSNFLQYTKLTYYTNNVIYDAVADEGIIVHTDDVADKGSSYGANNNLDTVEVHKYQRCDAASPGGSTGSGAGYYDTVALYAVETGRGVPAGQCQEL